MAREAFDQAGAYVSVKDLLGATVLFAPTEHVEEITTSFGTKDAVVTDLVVLSDGGAEFYDAMIFQGAIIARLKRNIGTGRPVLGVIAKGEAKKGQNAPYVLEAADEAGVQAARDYLAKNPEFMPAAPQVVQPVLQVAVPAPVAPIPAMAAPATPVDPSEDPFAV